MQYTKYAFAFVLLASSALAADRSCPTIGELTKTIVKLGAKTFDNLSPDQINSLQLSEEQKTALSGENLNLTNENQVTTALLKAALRENEKNEKDSIDTNFTGLELANQALNEKVSLVMEKMHDGKVSGGDNNLKTFENLLSSFEFDEISEYESNDTILTEEQLKKYLNGEGLPNTLQEYENDSDEEDISKKDSQTYSEFSRKINEILALTDDNSKVSGSSKLSSLLDDNADIIAAIKYQEDKVLKKKITEDVLIKIFKALTDGDIKKLSESQIPEQLDADTELNAKAKSILNLVSGDILLSTLADADFKGLATAEQIIAIRSKETETKKKITEQELIDILKAPPKNSNSTAEQDEMKKNAQKILDLASGDILLSTLADADFKGLATAEQIIAIRSKETETNAKITEQELIDILNAPPKNTKPTDLSGSVKGGVSSSSESKLWEKSLLWGIVGVAILAIGGGAYMMTRKTEETDL